MQFDTIKLIAGKVRNIFAVGDDDPEYIWI